MIFRLAEAADFSTCRTLLHPALGLNARIVDRLEDIWQRIAPTRTFAIVEDPALPRPAAIQGFGASVFVRDQFVEDFLAGSRRYLDATVYERILDGRSPVLSASEIAAANASALLNLI